MHDIRSFARAVWTLLSVAVGRPDELMRRGFINLRQHRKLADWLLHLENLVRRIVLALALVDFEARPERAPARRAARKRVTRRFTRPACFRVLEPLTPSPRAPRKRRAPDPRSPDDIPVRVVHLARRFEALRHAIHHTEDHARRVARAIARRLATPLRLTPKIGLRGWRVPSWRQTDAARLMAGYLLKVEPFLPAFLEDPG